MRYIDIENTAQDVKDIRRISIRIHDYLENEVFRWKTYFPIEQDDYAFSVGVQFVDNVRIVINMTGSGEFRTIEDFQRNIATAVRNLIISTIGSIVIGHNTNMILLSAQVNAAKDIAKIAGVTDLKLDCTHAPTLENNRIIAEFLRF